MRSGSACRLTSVLVLVAGLNCACASTPSTGRTAAMIADELSAGRLERTEHLSLGRFTMALVRTVARMAGDLDQDEAEIIKSIRRVEISTYAIDPPLQDQEKLRFDRVGQALAADGWAPMIRSQDRGGDTTLLLVRENAKGKISGMYVLTGDATELEVIRIEGKLDRIIAEAIADDPGMLGGLADS